MAIVHNTTLTPTKLELLTSWLPDQPWYRGAGTPELAKAGGFRLDDPAGEVGIEFMVVADATSPEVAGYLVPMTYRSEPLAEGNLIGTTEHGVLGTRYVYDGPSDPVFVAQLAALVRGKAEPQAQSISDTPDPTVFTEALPDAEGADIVRVLSVSADETDTSAEAGEVSVSWQRADGEQVRGVIVRGFVE